MINSVKNQNINLLPPIYKNKVKGIEVEVSFDNQPYSKDEANKLIAEFLFLLASDD